MRTHRNLTTLDWLGLLLGLISLSTPLVARPEQRIEVPSCIERVLAFQKSIGVDKINLGPYDYQGKPTLELIRWRPGRFGGKILIFRKLTKDIGTTFNSQSFDPQGDPRWFLGMLGTEASASLGMVDGENAIELPDATELIGILNAVSAELVRMGKAPLPVTYYLQQNLSYAHYNQGMGLNSLPLAPPTYLPKEDGTCLCSKPTDFTHYLHDFSHHLGILFLPNDLVEYFTASVRYQNELVGAFGNGSPIAKVSIERKWKALGRQILKKLANKEATPEKKADLLKTDPILFAQQELMAAISLEMRAVVTSRIDGATAELAPTLSFLPLVDPADRRFGFVFGSMMLSNTSASDQFYTSYQEFFRDGRTYPPCKYFKRKYGLEVRLEDYFDLARFQVWQSQFNAGYRSTNPSFDPKHPIDNYTDRLQRYCSEFIGRRADILEAIVRLKPPEL